MSEPAAPALYKIPADRLPTLVAGVDKLNRRAAKLGMDPVVAVHGEPRAEFLTARDSDMPPELRKKRWVLDVSFTGTAPRIKGFTFVAKLDHQDGGNLVLRAPGVSVDLDGWRATGSRCQHCGLERRRAQTFLLSTEKGELLQIGRQCLVDYIGTDDVANAVGWFKCLRDFLDSVSDEDGECGFGGGWSSPDEPLDYVAAAVSSVRHRGFHKSDSDYSTRKECDFILGDRPKPSEGSDAAGRAWDKLRPTEKQRAQALEIIDWVKASNDSSDFMHNARVAVSARAVVARTEGILAALPSTYDRFLGKEQERKARPVAGPHVGVVGQYIDCKVQVRYSNGTETEIRGGRAVVTGTFLIMVDENNSTIMARTSSREIQDCEDFDGDWYLRATVKKHRLDEKRNNQPVTVVTRIVMSRTPFPGVLKQPKRVTRIATKGTRLYGYLPNGKFGVVATSWTPKNVFVAYIANSSGGTSVAKAALAPADIHLLHGIWLWADGNSEEAKRRHLWAGGWYPKPAAMQQAVGQ